MPKTHSSDKGHVPKSHARELKAMNESTICPAFMLVSRATRIETEEGHLMQRSGGYWYAYPKIDPGCVGNGGEVLYEDATRRQLKKFTSALDAYTACLAARERHTQRAGAGRGHICDS